MTANTQTATSSKSVFREYWFAFLMGGIIMILLIWILRGNGTQVLLKWDPVWLWCLILVSVVVSVMTIGQIVTQRWLGVLINTLNKMSLSRLQIILWTLLIFSAYLTIAFYRQYGGPKTIQECQDVIGKEKTIVSLAACNIDAINIIFPPELLVAMGISAASFAGTTIIKSNKKKGRSITVEAKTSQAEIARKNLDEAHKEYTSAMNTAKETHAKKKLDVAQKTYDEELAAQKKADEEVEGLLQKNKDVNDARFSDIFSGDEIGNYLTVDMSKVQMFFLTIFVLAAYVSAVAASMHDVTALYKPASYTFPAFSESLNSLLAISHGTYLSVKTVNHTKTN